MVERIMLTADDIADDWPKMGRWDFPMVQTYDDFIGMVGDDVEAIGEFVQYPVWNAAPQAIREGVERHYPELVDLFFSREQVR
jgi:hypothetical protein